jgi:peptide-methionine (S)-S-oxide reductase
MGLFSSAKQTMVEKDRALPGRSEPIMQPGGHTVLGTPIGGPFPPGSERAIFGLGCFWGAERIFWQLDGVYATAVGYSGGYTPNPTYEEVCTGRTGHAEVVLVVFDPARISYETLLARFFEAHDPTQYMRQGNDVGTQYRSVIFTTSPEQQSEALAARDRYSKALADQGYGGVETEVLPAGAFYYAEDYHQQYLEKNPGGYCGLGGTGVSCPVPGT